MSDIIRLLPDSVANQIAAGEVIQRPASAVKELLENSIDAGATDVTIVIKDAGKSLIQIIDNGCGMSETDVRMAFERHATSKINSADDLFAIQTFGFRGEALASIAAISQVEVKTRKTDEEIGSCLKIEGSKVISHQPCNTSPGTSTAIKSLFFNVPARRKFLKSNNVETKHIFDEFYRVAIANPSISLSLYENNNQKYKLQPANQKVRIANLFGQNYNERLVSVEQETDMIKISGFIGKPEFARKTRGEQFFFVNGRFIKHPYFNHAVENAFEELIPEGAYPSYFIFFKINSKDIDINIHPTKTEVNFTNNQVIYAILKSAIKQSLGKFSLTPTIDFDVEQSFDYTPPPKDYEAKQPEIKVNPDFNPFETSSKEKQKEQFRADRKNLQYWQNLYPDRQVPVEKKNQTEQFNFEQPVENQSKGVESTEIGEKLFQIHGRFIVTTVKSGLMLIDQQPAHERILFEKFIESLDKQVSISQQSLFPQTVEFSASDAEIIKEIRTELKYLGFDIEEFGKNTYVVNGTPADLPKENVKIMIEGVLENYKKNMVDLKIDKRVNLARSLAKSMAIKPGKKLAIEEMQALIAELFKCKVTNVSPSGQRIIVIMGLDELNNKFR
jgi:DNA mismatch repair protein MutL